jgi:hypothetical protein
MTTQIVRLRSKVLLPLGLGFCVLLILGFSATYFIQKEALDNTITHRITNARVLFKELLKVEAEVLWSLTDSYREIKDFQTPFLAGNREQLLAVALPIFHEIKSRHNITHFYFHRLDKTCFLRVHSPERYGDQITRHTLNQAVLREAPAYGIELGPLGTMTLRLVQPWRVNGKLIGYIELGKEIDQITPILKHILNLEMVFTVEKSHLDRKLWEEGETMLNKPGNWEQFRDFVVVSSTFRQLPEGLGGEISRHYASHGQELFNIAQNNRTYRGGAIPLVDAAGFEIGDIFVFANYSDISSSRNLFIIVILLSTLALALFYALFTLYIGHIERNLQFSVDTLAEEIDRHRETTRQLAQHRDQLEVLTRQQGLELVKSKAEVKVLSGLPPICDGCKKIRNDTGVWEHFESYTRQHPEAEFSHGCCPECARKSNSQ